MPSLKQAAASDTPVVFVHNGPAQVIVTACAAQARAAGCQRIFVISDRIGPWALLPDVEFFPFSNAERFGAREFRSIFVNYSSYPAPYAAVIFEKFFALRALFAMHGLERILFLDSDLLLFTPARDLLALHPCDFSGTDCDADDHQTVSPHCMFLTPAVCDRICEDLSAAYGNEASHRRLQEMWERKKAVNPIWGVCEMDFLAAVRDSGEFRYAKLNQGNPRVDAAMVDPEGFVCANGLKVVDFENGLPYCTLEATGERIRFHALHMQGYVKHLVLHYARINGWLKRALYLLLKLEGRGWIKWPKARPLPTP